MVRLYRTFSIYIAIGETRCAGCLCTSSGWFKHIEPLLNLLELPNLRCARCNMHRFGEVQAHRTSSNLLELHPHRDRTSSNLLKLHPHRDSKVYRVLLHEFGVVRLYRTFSIYIVIGETRCAGCLCTSSGWFKHIEPLRTFSNYILTEIARYIEFL